MRDLNQDAGAVAGIGISAERASVLELAERADSGLDDVVTTAAFEIGHEVHATRIVLVARRV